MKTKKISKGTFILLLITLLIGCICDISNSYEPEISDTMLMFVGEKLYTISTASRLKEAIKFAPASAFVMGQEEIKRYRTLGEALKSVPGFYLGHDGIKEKIYLRGVPNSFLLMIDGVPMANDSSTEDYPRGLELSLDYIEKIEIIRGPGSALWGA
ncbi:MAG: Plug domain-containing protein, partial [Thermodesulfobacteriota bacterium]|nr:Plug domain-containing protein [Thermodesulfobacteriota bacterium]